MATRAEIVEKQRLAFMQREQERLARAEEQRMREEAGLKRQAEYQAGFSRAAEKRDAGGEFLKNLLGMGTETGGQNGVSVEFPSELRRRLSGASVQLPTEVTTEALPVIPAPVTPKLVTALNTEVRAPNTAVQRPVTIQTAVTNTTTDGLNTGTVTANNKNAPLPSLLGNNAAYSSLLGQGEYAGPSTGMNRFIQILERMAVPGKSTAQAFAEGNLSLSAQEAAAAQSYLDRGLSQQKLQAQQKLLQAEADFKNREEKRRIDELDIKKADYLTKGPSKDEAAGLIELIKSELASTGNKALSARVKEWADEIGWGIGEATYQRLAAAYRRIAREEELAGKSTSIRDKLTKVVNNLEGGGTPEQVKNSVTQQGNIGDPSVTIIPNNAGLGGG